MNKLIDKICDGVSSFFERFEKIMDKYPIVARLLAILTVVGVVFWLVWRIVVGLFAAIVWFVTCMIELCLTPVYFLIWIFIGKFPMFDMHFFILKKLKLHDVIYE